MFGTEYATLKHAEGLELGELTPTGSFTQLEKGTLMQRASADGESFSEIAGISDDADLILLRKVTEDGPSFEQMTIGSKDLPVTKGDKVAHKRLHDGDILEFEGEPSKAHNASSSGLLVTSGTGAISSATAAKTELSTQSGRLRVAQSGDQISFVLEKQLTPIVDASNIRILVRKVSRGVKA